MKSPTAIEEISRHNLAELGRKERPTVWIGYVRFTWKPINFNIDHSMPVESDPEELVRFVQIAAKYQGIALKSQQVRR